MNQILSTENNHKQKKTRNSELVDMRKVIIVFSVLIMAFAIVIIGAKVYGIIKEKSKQSPTAILNKPSINIEKLEQNLYRLEVSYDVGLETVTYWWNDEDKNTNNLHGFTEPYTITKEIPEGNKNILHVIATGTDGSRNEVNQEFVIQEEIEDPNKPKISLYHNSGTTKMDIIATSEKGIKSITYNWEGEEPITREATSENQKELKITIDVKRGANKLYVTATDSEGNTGTKDENIVGILAPEIGFAIENRTLKISIKHDMGFKKVIVKINNQELIYDENNPEYSLNTKDLNIEAELATGRTDVEVRVYTMETPDIEYKEAKYAEIPEE